MILRDARVKAGMSMQTLGKAVGVSAAAICRYEQGKRVPKIVIAKRIGKILGLKWWLIIDNNPSVQGGEEPGKMNEKGA